MSMSAEDILNREFLEIRAKILEIGASLDRLDRADGSIDNDVRRDRLSRGLEILLQTGNSDRAEQIQLLFSREYTSNWRESLNVPSSS